jgi:hypothetical protein
MQKYTKRIITVFNGSLQSCSEELYTFDISKEGCTPLHFGSISINDLIEWRDELNELIKDAEEEKMVRQI